MPTPLLLEKLWEIKKPLGVKSTKQVEFNWMPFTKITVTSNSVKYKPAMEGKFLFYT